jgi:hypothetical protein
MKFIELLESGSTFECEVFSDAHEESPYSFFWEPDTRVTQKGRERWSDLLNCGAHLDHGDIWLEGLENTEQYYDFLANAAGYGFADEYDELFETINLRGEQ